MPKTDSIWTQTFILLCIVQFLGYAHHFALIPMLPKYIKFLGYGDFGAGVIFSMFGLIGIFARPIVGRLSDKFGEVKLMVVGLAVNAASSVSFVLPFISLVGLANGLRGAGWGAINVGGTTLLSSITPVKRKGEATSYLRAAQLSTGVFFPAASLWLYEKSGFKITFAVISVLALIGIAVSAKLNVQTPQNKKESEKKLWYKLIDFRIALPLFLAVLLFLPQNATTSFAVLYAQKLGVENIEWLFIASGITAVVVQPLFGKISDEIAKSQATSIAFGLQAAAFISFSIGNLHGIVVGGILYILGQALGNASLYTLAMDKAREHEGSSGEIMGSFLLFAAISNFIGPILIGGLVSLVGYFGMYVFMSANSFAGLILTIVKRRIMDKKAV